MELHQIPYGCWGTGIGIITHMRERPNILRLTDRNAVLLALKEYDQVGREKFLSRYGFGESRSYWLRWNGKDYDSKAVVGAAFGYQHGTPLKPADFSGGAATVQRLLEALGFEVVVAGAQTARSVFWMTYKLDHWPVENVRKMVRAIETVGFADEPWRIAAHRQARKGDLAIAFKQGADPRGIIGIGRITGAPFQDAAIDNTPGKMQYFAPVRWEKFTDPTRAFLLPYAAFAEWVPKKFITAQGSGIRLPPDIAQRLLGLITPPDDVPELPAEIFDPSDEADGRRKILATIHRRQGQGAFRKMILTAYGGRCAITRCPVEPIVEAAHISPYLGPATNHPSNGIALRADVHTLFDLGMITIHPETLKVLIAPALMGTTYEALRDCCIRVPRDVNARPSPLALKKHFETVFLGCAEELVGRQPTQEPAEASS